MLMIFPYRSLRKNMISPTVPLSRNPGQVYTREMLIDIIFWGDDLFGSPRTVDTHIKTLRNAIRPYHEHIVTIRGVGYRFDE